MIEIFNPKKINPAPFPQAAEGWHYPLDYQWFLDQVREFSVGDEVMLDVGSGHNHKMATFLREVRGYMVVTLEQEASYGADITANFLDYEFKNKMDFVYWLSSIEHQKEFEDIHRCYLKSMEILKPGGVFVATFPISQITEWFEPAKQWNISLQDAFSVFDESTCRGRYDDIWQMYRLDYLDLRTRYLNRFGSWDINDPVYLAAGVVKVK